VTSELSNLIGVSRRQRLFANPALPWVEVLFCTVISAMPLLIAV